MTFQACAILGIKDRDFRDCELDTLKDAFSRKIITDSDSSLPADPAVVRAPSPAARNRATPGHLQPVPSQPTPQPQSQPTTTMDSALLATNLAAKMKHAYKEQMKVHEAYQFLLKRRTAQINAAEAKKKAAEAAAAADDNNRPYYRGPRPTVAELGKNNVISR